jgi:hypothetical protein
MDHTGGDVRNLPHGCTTSWEVKTINAHTSGSQTCNTVIMEDVHQFEKLVASSLLQWSEFHATSIHMGFVVDKVAPEQMFFFLRNSVLLLILIPQNSQFSSSSTICSNYNGPYTTSVLRDSVSSHPRNKWNNIVLSRPNDKCTRTLEYHLFWIWTPNLDIMKEYGYVILLCRK